MPSSLNKRLQSRTTQLWITAAVCAAFLLPALWQANRQPRVGDTDIIRVGLVVFNREIPEQFPGDLAMEAGTWWPGYTPAYITLLRLGFRLVGDLELLLFGLTALAYLALLTGFYRLGRRLGLPFGAALLLMVLSGLYQTTALGSAWTGVRLEMAAARNLYIGLLPWLLSWALVLVQHPRGRMAWALYGFVLGMLANLHSINGIFLLSVIGMALLIAVLHRLSRWQILAAFGIAALPGLGVVYLSTYTVYAEVVNAIVPAGEVYGYADLAKANVIFYRLPNWILPIGLYGTLTAITSIRLLLREAPLRWGWLAFGLTQWFGALLLLTADWLVLFAAGMWMIAVLGNEETPLERAAIWLMAIIALLALPVGLLTFTLADNGLAAAGIVSRALERGGTFVYLPVILVTVSAVWRMFRTAAVGERVLLSAAAAAALFNGMIQSYVLLPLEGITFTPQTTQIGQFLPVDGWTYAGVLLLLSWTLYSGTLRPIRFGIVGAVCLMAITRALGAPAMDVTALLFGVGCGLGDLWHTLNPQRATITRFAVGMMIAAVVVLLPIGSVSVIGRIWEQTPRALLRNWSREDDLLPLSATYRLGVWLRENTAPGSVVISTSSFLRYWAQRPLNIGSGDADFLAHNGAAYPQLLTEYMRLLDACADPAVLIALAQEFGGEFIVAPLALGLDAFAEVILVHTDDSIGIYTFSQP